MPAYTQMALFDLQGDVWVPVGKYDSTKDAVFHTDVDRILWIKAPTHSVHAWMRMHEYVGKRTSA